MIIRKIWKYLLAAVLSVLVSLPAAGAAYAAGSYDANTVNVAVFDGGFNPSDTVLSPYVKGCYNAVTGKEGAANLSDVDHGTSCAKILINTASAAGKSLGITCNINLYLVQVDAEGTYASYWESLKSGIEYALSKGCRIVSISLSDTKYHDETQQLITDAACRDENGILFVASGGNSGTNEYRYPASYSNVLSVAPLISSGSGYVISDSATYNDMIDLAAPGSTASAATPYAAGAAALMFQVNPSLKASSALQILTQNAADAGDSGIDEHYGYGILDLPAAVSSVIYRMERGHN